MEIGPVFLGISRGITTSTSLILYAPQVRGCTRGSWRLPNSIVASVLRNCAQDAQDATNLC